MSSKVSVVLVDDHEAVRQGLRALLEHSAEMRVIDDVGSIDAAIECVRTRAPDLVVLDLSMPKPGGFAGIRQIKAVRPNTAIVVLTRYRDSAFAREALNDGASAYVLKQSPFSELIRAVRLALAGKQYVDSQLAEAIESSAGQGLVPLTHREQDVLMRTVLGHSNKEIAVHLNIAVRTVEVHKANGMRKLDLHDRAALIRYAAIKGWLAEP